jgi:hypothetical protein
MEKGRYTQSIQSCLDAIFLGQIVPELKKTKWNKISDFLSSFFFFLVYQFFWPEGADALQRGHLPAEIPITS